MLCTCSHSSDTCSSLCTCSLAAFPVSRQAGPKPKPAPKKNPGGPQSEARRLAAEAKRTTEYTIESNNADAQIANAAYGNYVVRKARAKLDYQGGRGKAQLVADGSSGVPFSVAVNAALRPDLYAVALQGKAANIDFRLAQPAIIRSETGGYRLEPATLVLPQGKVDLAGRFGGTTAMQARFKDFDLAIANMAAPGLGVSGRATGTLDYTQTGNAFPTATTRLAINDFRRSSLTAVSDPVSMNVEGKLSSAGGDMRGLIRRGGTTLGRFIATLAPPGAGASWTEQLQNAPLGGGIRYSGPADVLFSFAGLADQQLTGGLAVAADFNGRLSDPRLNGVVRANSLTYENESFGTRVTQMRLDGRFTSDHLEIRDFSGRAGDGTVQATGDVGLAANSVFRISCYGTFPTPSSTSRLSSGLISRKKTSFVR